MENIIINMPKEEYIKPFKQAIEELRKSMIEFQRQRDLLIELHTKNHPDCEECTIHKVREILYK